MSGRGGRTPRVRVLVADDHPMYRQGVVDVIKRRPELELVGEAENGRAALDAIRELEPDVALLDMRMPELDGLRVMEALEREGRGTRIVFLSAQFSSESVYAALGAGARGFVSKEAGPAEVCEAVEAVARGETVLGREIQAALATEVRRRSTSERPDLTEREAQVLRMIADGLSAPEIGRRLHLSTTTVKTHLGSLYEKLGVSERAAAVAEAMRSGLIE